MKLNKLYRDWKRKKRRQQEEQHEKEQQQQFELNKFFMSQTMPDRGHDVERGTHGSVMGDPSPGRSF